MVEETKKHHEQIDPIFKQILEDSFASYKAVCQTEYEVGRLPRKIDALITIENAGELSKIRAETPFFYFLKDNQVEFKGRRDPLTKEDYHNIQGREHFLLGKQHISAFDMTVTIISAGKPRNVMTYAAQRKRPLTPVEDKIGYYQYDGYPPIYLIVVNDLPVTPNNYPLLVFASSERKFREFLEQVIHKGESTYIRYAYEVRPQLTKEILTMAGISATLSREDLEFMADDIGPELVPFLKAEDLLHSMDPEEQKKLLVSLLSLDDLLAAKTFEKLLGEVDPKNRKRLLELLSRLQTSSSVDQEEA